MPDCKLLSFLCRLIDLGDKMLKVQRFIAMGGSLGLCILWYIVHLIISIWCFTAAMIEELESFLISSGLIRRYKSLNACKVKYLAIVIDSEEARMINKVIELLRWLTTIGVKNICLYDSEGVLKNSAEAILNSLIDAKLFKEARETDVLCDTGHITLEFASVSDGKEAVAKAANVLLSKYQSGEGQERHVFTELDLTEALTTLGYGKPEPDLLLVYAPARCHLGFPPWRTRYTEIVHMGTLKSKKYGSLVKAIHKFTKVHQNYGK